MRWCRSNRYVFNVIGTFPALRLTFPDEIWRTHLSERLKQSALIARTRIKSRRENPEESTRPLSRQLSERKIGSWAAGHSLLGLLLFSLPVYMFRLRLLLLFIIVHLILNSF